MGLFIADTRKHAQRLINARPGTPSGFAQLAGALTIGVLRVMSAEVRPFTGGVSAHFDQADRSSSPSPISGLRNRGRGLCKDRPRGSFGVDSTMAPLLLHREQHGQHPDPNLSCSFNPWNLSRSTNYPPGKQERATQTLLQRAEVPSDQQRGSRIRRSRA